MLDAHLLTCSTDHRMVRLMTSKMKISQRALLQRLNRKLADEKLIVKKTRGEKLVREVGNYFLLDLHRNRIAEKDVDLPAMGRERGGLEPWESRG